MEGSKKMVEISKGSWTLLICVVGIYTSFLTWALLQEPLTTKVWSNSQQKFQFPNVIVLCQAFAATLLGLCYLRWKQSSYKPFDLVRDYSKQLMLISFTQSGSAPLATYSLQYVDYLTFMLAKSCKMIPVLLVHVLLYRTQIAAEKKIVALLVSLGVTIFTMGSNKSKLVSQMGSHSTEGSSQIYGFGLLGLSLFLDGLTNATQDKLLRTSAKSTPEETKENSTNKKNDKLITGAHLMFALNLFIILWNIPFLSLFHRSQVTNAINVIQSDPEILMYLITYSTCGAIGQCFIFYTLEQYGSLVLIMITVTRKMISMILSIFVFGKTVNLIQWIGISIVFGGISWEAMNKQKQKKKSPEVEEDKKNI